MNSFLVQFPFELEGLKEDSTMHVGCSEMFKIFIACSDICILNIYEIPEVLSGISQNQPHIPYYEQ